MFKLYDAIQREIDFGDEYAFVLKCMSGESITLIGTVSSPTASGHVILQPNRFITFSKHFPDGQVHSAEDIRSINVFSTRLMRVYN